MAVLAGCGGGGGGSSSTTGTLKLALTDAPACGYDHVYVTVDRVRVHQSTSAADSDTGWQEIALSPARKIDLLALTNGVLEELGQTALPAGTYTQMRLVLVDNAVTAMANSVVPTGGVETPLTTPSAQQSGLKMNVNITVEPEQVADFVIDFDACKSVVKRGNSGQYNLKPVLSVTPRIGDAGQRIVGYIDTVNMPLAATSVSAQDSTGTVVKATLPDPTTGQFVLYPIPAGTYNLVVTAPGRATGVITGVPVVTTAYTYIGSDTVRINLDTSTSNDATGTVTLNGSAVDTAATVRVLQALAGGPTVEITAMPVDALTGGYTYALPVEAPMKTAYQADPTAAITFVDDSTDPALTAAGKYTLQASILGHTTQTADIDVTGGTVDTDFAFTTP